VVRDFFVTGNGINMKPWLCHSLVLFVDHWTERWRVRRNRWWI